MKNIFNPKKVFIIAEAGVNHDGRIEQAFKLIDIAAEARADAVKFQIFKPGECTGKFSFKVGYLKKTTLEQESRYEMSCRLALSYDDFCKLKSYCVKRRILFLSTPDGYESLEFVNNVLKVPLLKVSSTEVTHLNFLEEIAKKRKPIIFSTGMSTLGEIEIALKVMQKYNDDITVLHCTSEYPAPAEDVNLKAMITIRNAFGVKVGYSDHTLGFEASIAAVALGATVIEKHFTIDRNLLGPDHKASLLPEELKEFVKAIRRTEKILGEGSKVPSESERKNINGMRRSIVAARNLKANTCLTPNDLTFKRPATGIHPYDFEKVLNMRINKDLQKDEPLRWEHLR